MATDKMHPNDPVIKNIDAAVLDILSVMRSHCPLSCQGYKINNSDFENFFLNVFYSLLSAHLKTICIYNQSKKDALSHNEKMYKKLKKAILDFEILKESEITICKETIN